MKTSRTMPAAFKAALGLAVLVLLSACQAAPAAAQADDAWKDPAILAARLEASPPVVPSATAPSAGSWAFIDVRTPAEYAEGHIPGALNIPLDTLASRMGEWPRDGLYVLYCRSGNRSGQAKAALDASGFTRVVNFGGISRWKGVLARQ